jgi:hypothetical protein
VTGLDGKGYRRQRVTAAEAAERFDQVADFMSQGFNRAQISERTGWSHGTIDTVMAAVRASRGTQRKSRIIMPTPEPSKLPAYMRCQWLVRARQVVGEEHAIGTLRRFACDVEEAAHYDDQKWLDETAATMREFAEIAQEFSRIASARGNAVAQPKLRAVKRSS